MDGKAVYNTLIKMLDAKEWNYKRHDEDLVITTGVRGEDLPMDIILRVLTKLEVVQFISTLPFKMPEDKLVEGAIAVCTANHRMINGSFDYDLSDGEIRFRMASGYSGCEISEDMLYRMLMVGASTVDHYNDKFFMISKGMLSIKDFIEQEMN